MAQRGIKMPAWDATNPAVVKAWQDISAEYASGVSGAVRAVIGQSLRSGNVWETAELPALMKNPNVDEIITIDPVTVAEKVIYLRGEFMILEVSRGHIQVKIGDRTATSQGEMFFPGNDKIGFVLYRGTLRFWDAPNQYQIMTVNDVDMVVADIQADFFSGGHILEVEN